MAPGGSATLVTTIWGLVPSRPPGGLTRRDPSRSKKGRGPSALSSYGARMAAGLLGRCLDACSQLIPWPFSTNSLGGEPLAQSQSPVGGASEVREGDRSPLRGCCPRGGLATFPAIGTTCRAGSGGGVSEVLRVSPGIPPPGLLLATIPRGNQWLRMGWVAPRPDQSTPSARGRPT